MARALLINPSYRDSYGSAKAKIVDPIFPTLSLLTTAAAAEAAGHSVEILDLSYRQYDYRLVEEAIRRVKPDVLGVTATTPLMNQARDISVLAKSISRDILVVAGGAHVSSLPAESLEESLLDMVVVGEGDRTFPEILDGKRGPSLAGVYAREGGTIVKGPSRPFVEDLDSLPLPAWHLYDKEAYRLRVSRLYARRPPLASAEFSRGCVYGCEYCASKMTMALGYRKKSPRRCAEEARRMASLGYREFFLADDIFTSDVDWAKSVCEELIRARTGLLWSCTNGIRVESADAELFRLMRRAGCYRVAFGFESGDDAVLKAAQKGGRASVESGRVAVALAREAGLDTLGYFMLGLSTDTEETMARTIEFARSLPLDMLKFGITIAFPGTPLFKEYRQKGLVRSYDWDDYFMYTNKRLFAHPNLDFEEVQDWCRRGWRRAVLTNPAFIARRAWRAARTGELLWDAYYLARFLGSSPLNAATHSARYFARDRWPSYDFARRPLTYHPPRPASERAGAASPDEIRI